MTVLPRYISTGNRHADGPPFGGGRSAVISDKLEQNRFWLCGWSKMTCGPSGPWGGRSAFKSLNGHRNLVVLSWVSKMTCGPSGPWGRTVRLLLKILGQKHCGFCVCSLFELRTVRPWGADSPPVTSRFSQRRLQIGWFEVLSRGRSAPGVRTVRPGL